MSVVTTGQIMLRFLRLFSQYRELELLGEHRELDVRSLEGNVLFWRTRAEVAESERDKISAELTHTLKLVANHQAVQAGCVQVPFPDIYVDIPKPPEGIQDPRVEPPRMPRDIQRAAVAESRRKAAIAQQVIRNRADSLGLDSL